MKGLKMMSPLSAPYSPHSLSTSSPSSGYETYVEVVEEEVEYTGLDFDDSPSSYASYVSPYSSPLYSGYSSPYYNYAGAAVYNQNYYYDYQAPSYPVSPQPTQASSLASPSAPSSLTPVRPSQPVASSTARAPLRSPQPLFICPTPVAATPVKKTVAPSASRKPTPKPSRSWVDIMDEEDDDDELISFSEEESGSDSSNESSDNETGEEELRYEECDSLTATPATSVLPSPGPSPPPSPARGVCVSPGPGFRVPSPPISQAMSQTQLEMQRLLGSVVSVPIVLEHPWSFWFHRFVAGSSSSSSGAHSTAEQYEAALQRLGSFHSVQTFWQWTNNLPALAKLEASSTLHLMKDGVRPLWEDDHNAEGGTMSFRVRKAQTEQVWQHLLLTVIGEQYDCVLDPLDEICGASVSIRKSGGENVISLWNKRADRLNQAALLRRILTLFSGTGLEIRSPAYKVHKKEKDFNKP
ncbi:hypothetical protein QOT17_002545 [Balamuthia mandrillaris]